MQVEWLGRWLDLDLMGPWPKPGGRPVYVLTVGPLYVSLWPWMLAEQRAWLG